MKKLAIVATLFITTAAFAQTTEPTPVNPQITDAVTQLQEHTQSLEARIVELEATVDEIRRLRNIETSRTFFRFDSTEITEGADLIKEVAAFMKDYPSYVVTVEGHTDERGTREYNLYLGEKRASFAKEELVKLGIDANRIQTVSYGKERPAVLGSSEIAWKQNRRIVFVLVN